MVDQLPSRDLMSLCPGVVWDKVDLTDLKYLYPDLDWSGMVDGASEAPILVKKNIKKPQVSKTGTSYSPDPSPKYAVAVRCNCNSVWCPKCYKKNSAPRQSARMLRMKWDRVRMVTLTLDPSNWEDGEQAYIWYKQTKAIGRFIQKLGRNGVNVTDWTCNMEWHDNGYPHFHLLIEVDKPGKAGMIGQDLIHECWAMGDKTHRIHEYYFKTEKRFKEFTGYFAKSGYLHKDKQHQIILPGWASGRGWEGMKINRFSSMRRPVDKAEEPEQKAAEPEKRFVRRLTYAAKHERCGQSVDIWEVEAFEGSDGEKHYSRTKVGRYHVPYDLVVNSLAGDFYEGFGFSFEGTTGFVCNILSSWEKSPPRPPERPREYHPAQPAFMLDMGRERHFNAVFGPFIKGYEA